MIRKTLCLARRALPLLTVGTLMGQGSGAPLVLTHKEALRLGMTNLLQVRIAKELREEFLQEPEAQRGIFDWNLSAALFNSREQFADTNPRFSGLANLYYTALDTTVQSRGASMDLSKLTPYGGTLDLNFTATYNNFGFQESSQTLPVGPAAALAFGTVNPYAGRLSLGFTQPLLQGFGRPVTEARLRAALEEAKAADESFRKRMEDLLVLVDDLYWNQVHARQNLINKQAALDLARKQLSEDQDRVKSGMLAPLELPQTEAAVAEREKSVIAAKGALKDAQDALMDELFPEGDQPPAIEAKDMPGAGPEPPVLEDAVETGLVRRPELAAASHDVAARESLEAAARNYALPKLDTRVAVMQDSNTHSDASGVWNDWTQSDYPGYYVGLTFSYPLGNRFARARLAQARAATLGSELSLRDARTTVRLDVEQAYTGLVSARKQVEAADKGLTYRIESLDAEMTKLDNGMSTSFFVLQRQEELDQSKTLDLDARIAVEKARTRLQRAIGTLEEILD
ncbi:MAG: TolC family protein [Holophaga sp.]|jgi:outer membrane protein TolC